MMLIIFIRFARKSFKEIFFITFNFKLIFFLEKKSITVFLIYSVKKLHWAKKSRF